MYYSSFQINLSDVIGSVVQQLGIKLPLMSLMESKDPDVKKYALTAVQKIMVTNWEYLSL